MADLRIVDAPVLLQESITDDVKMPTGGLGNFSIRLGDILWYVVTKENLASKSYVDLSSKGVKDSLDAHIADKANPHNVTKAQVGLGNVDNTADIDKPVSNAVESSLLTKANKIDTYSKSEVDTKVSTLSSTTYAGHKGYLTLADAQAAQASLPANTLVEVTSDSTTTNNGVYLWNGTTLTKGSYDPLMQAKSYTDNSVEPIVRLINKDNSEPLEMAVDDIGLLYRYIDSKGNVFYSGKKLEMQDWSTYTDDSTHVRVVLDRDSNVVAILDKDGNFRIAGDIIFGGGSLTEVLANASNLISPEKINLRIAGQTYQNALINRFPARSEFTSIMTLEESGGLRNRMVAGVRVPTGLFMVWHRQTSAQYDGDGNGSAFWCGFADIDSNYNITIRDRKLFISPDTPAGIIKHPHLGRTSDNRLILIYEKSIGYSEATPENPVNYIKYVMYSSDNGVTWTAPTQLVFNNSAPTTTLMALGTTCEVLKLKTGRLIVAMYSTGGLCFCIYSDNDGASWSYSKSWISLANWGYEPSIALDSESNLVMSIRPKGSPNAAAFAKSTDNGENWELMHTDRLVSSNNQSFLLYDDSIQAHLISHTTSEGRVRTNFRISISYDDCYTFPLTYAPFPNSKFVGYTQLIKWADGVYLLLMEYNDTWSGSINTNEQIGIQLINTKEVFNNVNRT